jgi:hypothetical protein
MQCKNESNDAPTRNSNAFEVTCAKFSRQQFLLPIIIVMFLFRFWARLIVLLVSRLLHRSPCCLGFIHLTRSEKLLRVQEKREWYGRENPRKSEGRRSGEGKRTKEGREEVEGTEGHHWDPATMRGATCQPIPTFLQFYLRCVAARFCARAPRLGLCIRDCSLP